MSNKLICAITLFAAVTLQVHAAHAEPAADALVTEAVPAEVSNADSNLGRYIAKKALAFSESDIEFSRSSEIARSPMKRCPIGSVMIWWQLVILFGCN